MKGDHVLKISELFYSIQGESTYAGLPCVFIRLHGCNLRCSYCDARYTYDESGDEKSINEISKFVDRYPGAIVEITGGEPLLQSGTINLASYLSKSGRTVLIETNGSLDISQLPPDVVKIIDLKCPDSEMSHHMCWDNLDKLGPLDEVKFVLGSRSDYEWALEKIHANRFLSKILFGKILFSPVIGKLDPKILADWILEDSPPARLQLQLHKQIWPDCQRGV